MGGLFDLSLEKLEGLQPSLRKCQAAGLGFTRESLFGRATPLLPSAFRTRRDRASQYFRSFWGAWRTIAGYEAVHMNRKGQPCESAAGAKVRLLHRFIVSLFAATN